MFVELDDMPNGTRRYLDPEKVAVVKVLQLFNATGYDFFSATGFEMGRIVVDKDDFEKQQYVDSILNRGKDQP